MMHTAPPIGLAETPRGMLVSLPPRFWLVVGLRRSFPRVQPAAEPWTYLVPGKPRRLGEWIAEVELQLMAERRRRLWSADDTEWSGTTVPATPAAPIAAEPVIVVLPTKRTARPVLELLQRLVAGERLVSVITGEGRTFWLTPSGRAIRPGIAARAIGDRLVVPTCDGLLGPDSSQTWRTPTREELDAAELQDRQTHPRRRRRKRRAAAQAPASETHRSRRGARARPAKDLVRNVARTGDAGAIVGLISSAAPASIDA